MNLIGKNSKAFITNYELACQPLKDSYFNFFSKSFCERFYSHWFFLHCNVLHQINHDTVEQKEEIIQVFLKKRVRFFSSFLQTLMRKDNSAQQIKVIKDFVSTHDAHFKKILMQVLQHYSEELVQVQRFRRVSAAYQHTTQFFGG